MTPSEVARDLAERGSRQFRQLRADESWRKRHFPNLRFIWIRRKDTAAQAISWAKAIQTGRWHHWDSADSSVVPEYDRSQIAALAREVVQHNASWEAWFAANGIQPLVVRFEDLVVDPILVTREALSFTGVGGDGVTIRPQTLRTADHVNAEWLARYRA